MPVLRPGTTVLARQISTGKARIAILEGRNGCRPEEWIAHFYDERGKKRIMVVFPGEVQAVKAECGFQAILPGMV